MALVQISRRSALAFCRAFSVRTLTMASGIKNSSEPLEESPTSSVDGVRQGWGKTLCSDVLHAKKDAGSWLWCSQEDTVLDAVKKMARANVGALLVYNPATLGSTDSQHVTGIVSERDYLTKIAVANKSSATTLVKEIMTTKLLTVGPTTTVMEAMELMCENNVRHVPVVDGSSLNGMLSVRDVVTVLVKEHREEVDHLNQWISGTY